MILDRFTREAEGGSEDDDEDVGDDRDGDVGDGGGENERERCLRMFA